MPETSGAATAIDLIDCPLCLGRGKLQRVEILERLGVRDFARVAQLSAEEAFRLLLKKRDEQEQANWSRFESELAKRTAEIEERYKSQLASLEAEKKVWEQQRLVEVDKVRNELQVTINAERSKSEDLNRKVETYLADITKLTEQKKELEAELSKVRRTGRLEEIDFQEEVRTWPGIWISDKLPRYGDYILAYRDPSGEPLEPRMLIDNKEKDAVTEGDISKLVRDTQEQSTPVGILVAHDENQLRQSDRERRWDRVDGIWILRTARSWLRRDLDILKPILEKMRVEGPDFMERNVALAREVRRTFEDIDAIEKELKKAGEAIENSKTLVSKHRKRLEDLCESASGDKTAQAKPISNQADGAGN